MNTVDSLFLAMSKSQKRKRVNDVFSVSFTEFEDDYKHRYDNGVYQRGPYLFSTRDKAEAFLQRALEAYVMKYLYELGDLSEWRPYLQDKPGGYDEDAMYKLHQKETIACFDRAKIRENLDSLLEKARKAEFVGSKMDWKIDRVVLDETVDPPF